jgi:hypothetical protein
LTERKHCNRFIESTIDDEDVYTFRPADVVIGDELDSQFKAMIPFESETYGFEYFDSNSTIPTEDDVRNKVNIKLNETLWLYAFFTPPSSAGGTNYAGTLIVNDSSGQGKTIDTNVRVLVAPFKAIYLKNTSIGGDLTATSAQSLLVDVVNNGDLNARCIALKVSPMCPFNNRYNFYADGGDESYFDFYTINGVEHLRFNYEGSPTNNHADRIVPTSGSITNDRPLQLVMTGTGSTTSTWGNNARRCIGLLSYSPLTHPNKHFVKSYNYDANLFFENALPTNSTNKSKIYEPKLKTLPYNRFELTTAYSQPLTLNPIYFSNPTNENLFRIEANDIPTFLDQKFTYMVDRSLDNFYYKNQLIFNKSLQGNNSYNLAIRSDKFSEYVANHNNYMISGLAIPAIQSGISAVSSFAMNRPEAGISATIGGVINAFNFKLTMDDLERSPDTIKSTGNNFLHDFSNGQYLGTRINKYGLTSQQEDMVFDYFYKYGYRINRDCFWDVPINKGQDALFNRSRFNYVKTMDDELFRKISSTGTRPFPIRAKEIIASALNKGITIIEASNTGTTTISNFNEDKENIELLTTTS